MSLERVKASRLVKSADLNHHGTLFAGRCAEWFVESGFIAVARVLDPKFVVCLKIHGMAFLHPVKAGNVLTFESMIVKAGRSTIKVHIRVFMSDTPDKDYCEGFMTFCYVDENTHSRPHGLVVEPETDEEKRLHQEASELK